MCDCDFFADAVDDAVGDSLALDDEDGDDKGEFEGDEDGDIKGESEGDDDSDALGVSISTRPRAGARRR